MSEREFDLIVWGATGFTGRRIAADLAANEEVKAGVTWAIAGRNQAKLEEVLSEIGEPDVPIILADSADQASLDAMVGRAKVIIAAAGPFADFGSGVVAACAKHGTDYVDITGEKVWVRDMIEQHHEAAAASGARIVPTCGFDCIPFDIGVYQIQKLAEQEFGEPSKDVIGRIWKVKLAASGGSMATTVNTVLAARSNPSIIRTLRDPFALSWQANTERPEQPDAQTRRYDPETGRWAIAFPLSGTNMAVVHRSNMLMGFPYGADFKYSEMQSVPDEKKAKRSDQRLKFMLGLMVFAPTRALLRKFVLPKPGDGPSDEVIQNNPYEVRFYAKGPEDKIVEMALSSSKDPGYASTPLLVIEAALCLLKDVSKEETPGGLYSPVAAMKDALLTRVQANAEVKFIRL